jgi:hypothetical protein
MPRADRSAAKAVACYQHHAADSGRRGRTAGFGNSGNAECGLFGLARAFLKHGDRRHVGVKQIKIGKCSCQQRGIGEPGEFVVWRRARHGDGALGQRVQAICLDVVGRNRRLLAADQDAKPDIVAFRALRLLDRAIA